MMMTRLLVMAPLLLALAGCTAPKFVNRTETPKYRAGQVWAYRTRAGEERSRLTVLKVISDPRTEVVFVGLEGLHITLTCARCAGPALVVRSIGPIAFSREALDRSTVALEHADSPTDRFASADVALGPTYQDWRKGRSTYISTPVAEFLEKFAQREHPNEDQHRLREAMEAQGRV